MAIQATSTDKFVSVNGLRIHYLDWGNAPAAPVFMPFRYGMTFS